MSPRGRRRCVPLHPERDNCPHPNPNQELKKALATIGLKGDTTQAKSVIEEFDKAGNGALNLVEFQDLVKRLQSMGLGKAPAPARSGGLGGYYQGGR